MELFDTLGRRKRYAPPRPGVDIVNLTDHHINKICVPLHLFGPLSTEYLQIFGGYKSKNACQHALAKLYDGYCAKRDEHIIEDKKDVTVTKNPKHICEPINYLTRYDTYFTEPLFHDINDRTRAILSRQGKLSPFIKRHDHEYHRTFNAAITGSMYLAAPQQNITFKDQSQVLYDGSQNDLPIPISHNSTWEPDYLFQVVYPDGFKRVFALETDRDTEDLNKPKRGQTARETIEGKFTRIVEVLTQRLYRAHWDVKGVIPLFATNNLTWMRLVQKKWKEIAPDFADQMLFQYFPYFQNKFTTAPVLWNVFQGWETADGKPFDLAKK